MSVIHGALVLLKKDGIIVAKGSEFSDDRETPLTRSEPLGQYQPDEIIPMASYIRCSFRIEREANNSIVDLGLFPPQATIEDMINHPESMLEIEDRQSGVTLLRILGFKAERVSESFRKGDITFYDVSGEGIRGTDEAEN